MTSYLVYPNYFDEEFTYLKNFTKALNGEDSPLHRSILDERVYLLQAQLEDPSVDVNVRNQNIESPLLSALRLQNKEISLNLMSKLVVHPNVDVNLPDYHGDTPLHEAVKNETSLISEVILTTLLRNPTVKINVKNYLGETPLHVAKTVAAARQLVEKGADINRRDGSYNTPLHKQVKNPEVCDFLLRQGVEVNARNIKGFTPLHEAVYYKVEETVIMLLEYGADANLENDYTHKITPLQIACRVHAAESIKSLLWEKTKPKYLLFAASYDSTQVPQILKDWSTLSKEEDELVEFLLELIILLKSCDDLRAVTCGRLVTDHFFSVVHLLSPCSCQRITKKFVEYLIKSYYLERSLLSFVIKTHDYSRPSSLEEITSVVDVLVQKGETVDFSDLEFIYLQFGDCDLLHDLIKTNVTSRRRKLKQVPFFIKAIWNVANDPKNLMEAKSLTDISVMDFHSIHTLARYCTLPPLLFKNFHNTYKNIIKYEKPELCTEEMEVCLQDIKENIGIPSLLELSRNAVRPALCRRYKLNRAAELYALLKMFGLPPRLISIIMMENPLFYHIEAPTYLPYTRARYYW
ncbi:uncharacterized protein LOC135133366 [Zophobas morio]|uniref:uncharacterized protein LOC135133366 n=1 Tax=Zophobas morio TaxID=2755281 RepID=UPI00308342F4